jgi:hypothetical protein
MRGLDPRIVTGARAAGVTTRNDGRVKPGHDGLVWRRCLLALGVELLETLVEIGDQIVGALQVSSCQSSASSIVDPGASVTRGR